MIAFKRIIYTASHFCAMVAVVVSAMFATANLLVADQKAIHGTGASFPADVYYAWISKYKEDTGNRVSYLSVGSGSGVKQLKDGVVDFGASDEPLSAEDIKASNIYQFPTVAGAIAVVYNLDGIKDGELKLSNEAIEGIFMGKVKNWDDELIRANNPGLKLPSSPINIVYRSDGSGTTYNFSTWLSGISKEWKEKIGIGKSLTWPSGVGAKGNEGVTQVVKQSKNSIGYVELGYKENASLGAAMVKDATGEYVYPSLDSIAKNLEQGLEMRNDYLSTSLISRNVRGAYPISTLTYILIRGDSKNKERVRDFFVFSLKNGDNIARELNFLPLPSSIKEKVYKYLSF